MALKILKIPNKHLFLLIYKLLARIRVSLLNCACFTLIAFC